LLNFSVIASGSTGNAIYIESETTKILLDAGISGKQLQSRMQATCQASFADLSAVLVTHEHVDHVRGLTQAVKLSDAAVYMTEGTWSAVHAGVAKVSPPERHNTVRAGDKFVVGDIHVTAFAVSHDAEEPIAYRFDAGEDSLAVVTDLGYVSDAIKDVLYGCKSFVFESNHDVNMLRAGRYPWSVKRRILGDKGHLSNEDAAQALSDILATDEVYVYLAHLSEENNQPDLAELTVQSVLTEIKAAYGEQVYLRRTSRAAATALCRANTPVHQGPPSFAFTSVYSPK